MASDQENDLRQTLEFLKGRRRLAPEYRRIALDYLIDTVSTQIAEMVEKREMEGPDFGFELVLPEPRESPPNPFPTDRYDAFEDGFEDPLDNLGALPQYYKI